MNRVRPARYRGNPIPGPIQDHPFEAQNVSNAGAVVHEGKVHILYRDGGHRKREPPVKGSPPRPAAGPTPPGCSGTARPTPSTGPTAWG